LKGSVTTYQIIRIHPMAPPKPAWGDNCNGCGVCCAAEPCPVGVLVSGRRQGACSALEWQEAARRYVCGVVAAPERHLGAGLGRIASIFPTLLQRMISAGSGCDSDARLID
jgi:hypothetical protein